MLYSFGDRYPNIDETAYVTPGCHIIGDICLKANSNVWFGASLRGDNERITLGERSNIQENAILHTDLGFELVIGDDCTIGHGVIAHGCKIGNGTLIGMGAIILNGAKIGSECLVGAGALVTEGKVFEPGWLIIGSPAKAVRELTPEERAGSKKSAANYVKRAQQFRDKLKPC